MDIYKQKGSWKIVLAALGTLILAITLIYSNYLASRLKESEHKNTYIYSEALEKLAENENLNEDVTFQDTIIKSFTLPIILEDESGELQGQNFIFNPNPSEEFLHQKKQDFLDKGLTPIESEGYARYIYYFDSELLIYIRYFPIIQVFLVGLFIALGYYLFNTARKAEQNRVWTGMAKETAHQLGTPISAIIAWIEHLKELNQDNDENLEIIHELRNDVNQLELIADRFSKIGSVPLLEKTNVIEELEKCMGYMKRRAPKQVEFSIESRENSAMHVMINQHLFDWVIENILRNALDAMDRAGKIQISVFKETNFVCIDIKDTGKGIQVKNQSKIFQPGFSTKQRGWGLGLSLAKRIIENYHSGKIFIRHSKPHEGTTMTIKLPAI